jgi:hypothetical protein
LVARYTIKKLFAGKLFLGGFKRRFNPDAIPYTLGKRHQIYILDMFHSNFRIRKLLLFVETASRRRINTLFVLRKGWNFGPSIVPVSYYVPHYTGGILSNFSAVLRHYEKNAINHFVEEFPGIVCFFTNYTIQTAQALNEARGTRTPCTYLFDATMAPHQANYGVTGSLEYGSALLLTELMSTAARRGKRKEKFLFTDIIRGRLKEILRNRGITKISPAKRLSNIVHGTSFYKPHNRRNALRRSMLRTEHFEAFFNLTVPKPENKAVGFPKYRRKSKSSIESRKHKAPQYKLFNRIDNEEQSPLLSLTKNPGKINNLPTKHKHLQRISNLFSKKKPFGKRLS